MISCKVTRTKLVSGLQKIVALTPKVKSDSAHSIVRVEALTESISLTINYSDIYFQTTVPAEVEATGVIHLHSKSLYDIVASCEKEITILSSGVNCVIGSENVKWSEPLVNHEMKLLEFGELEATSVIDAQDFLTALSSTKYAIDGDSIRPSYYMVNVVDGRFRACNGHQYHEERTPSSNLSFSISANYVDGLSTLLRSFSGDVEFTTIDTRYIFKNNGDIFAIKKQSLSFPDLDTILVKPLRRQSPALLQVTKHSLVKALKSVLVGYDENYPYVDLHISKDNLVVKNDRGLGRTALCEVPITWDSAPRIATFKLKPLLSTILNAEELDLEIRLGSDTKERRSPMVIEGGSSWAMINQVNLRR